MRIFPHNVFIQNLEADFLRENFLVSSIITIFVIRFFLLITDYPQLSGAGLHIAHLLWGGFFMVIAFLLVFSFLSRGAMSLTSVLAGVGFGAFIDELGKFITSDNNYFFQPTIAIIYVIFVLLYITSKALSTRQIITEQEYLINAIDIVKEVVISDLDEEEKNKALTYLKRSKQSDQLVKLLTNYLNSTKPIPMPEQSLWTRFRHLLSQVYIRASQSELLNRTLIFILIFQTAFTGGTMLAQYLIGQELSIPEVGQLIASFISAVFIILGIISLSQNKVLAYRFFKLAVLVAIFLTQFFLFYREQFLALIGLGLDVVLLAVIDYTLGKETVQATQTRKT